MTHVFPVNDEQDHDLESLNCHCGPRIDWENSLVIHSSFDGRELVEMAEAIKEDAST
jgi:hypothetical protein